MAVSMAKFFEVRWKPIEKKLHVSASQHLPSKSGICEDVETIKQMPPNKKRKVTSVDYDKPKPIKQKMSEEQRLKLGGELESWLGEMPVNVIDFL
jgi:hypothetical protein